MNLNAFNVDFVTVYKQAKEYAKQAKNKERKTPKTDIKISIGQLQYYTKFIASIPKEGFSHRIYELKAHHTVTASDGEKAGGNQVKALLFLMRDFSLSNWLSYKTSDPDYPTFSAAVPYVLYAHKLHNGTMYNEWKTEKGLDKILNPYLRAVLLQDGEVITEYPVWHPSALLDLRGPSLIWGGKPQSVTAWNLRKSGNSEFDALGHRLRRMMLQTWMFSAEKRNKWMITDPLDWDAVAPLLEEQDMTTDPTIVQGIQDIDELGEW